MIDKREDAGAVPRKFTGGTGEMSVAIDSIQLIGKIFISILITLLHKELYNFRTLTNWQKIFTCAPLSPQRLLSLALLTWLAAMKAHHSLTKLALNTVMSLSSPV